MSMPYDTYEHLPSYDFSRLTHEEHERIVEALVYFNETFETEEDEGHEISDEEERAAIVYVALQKLGVIRSPLTEEAERKAAEVDFTVKSLPEASWLMEAIVRAGHTSRVKRMGDSFFFVSCPTELAPELQKTAFHENIGVIRVQPRMPD